MEEYLRDKWYYINLLREISDLYHDYPLQLLIECNKIGLSEITNEEAAEFWEKIKDKGLANNKC